jgi:pimeloyl-ACP methyl ester carboxylesterase
VVFYSHGFSSSRLEALLAHKAAKAAGIAVVAIDRPGCGGSDWYPGRRLEEWASDVALVADQLGVRRFGMLGVSGGAPTAIAAAAELPERISALTVVSGMAPLSLPGVVREVNPINRIVFGLGKRCPRVALACIAAMGGLWRRCPPLVDLWFRVLLPESDRVICRRPRVATVGRRAIGEGLTQGVRGPVSDLQLLMSEWQEIIERVRVPCSVWHGESDTIVPFAMGRALSQALHGSSFHAVPDAGHFMIVDLVPQVLADAVRGFAAPTP